MAGLSFASAVVLALMLAVSSVEAKPERHHGESAIRAKVVAEAKRHHVPPSLALAVAMVESNFRPRARSARGARGVMQVMPSTAWGHYRIAKRSLYKPSVNIRVGVRLLRDLHAAYGDWNKALLAYHAGRTGMKRLSDGKKKTYLGRVAKWQTHFSSFDGPAATPILLAGDAKSEQG